MDSEHSPSILYCNCTYAKVVPPQVKRDVLRSLTDSGAPFESVADLCEMSARKDPALNRIAACGNVRIAACYPRAVKWLFHAAQAPLPEEGVEILNMREQDATVIRDRLLSPDASPSEANP